MSEGERRARALDLTVAAPEGGERLDRFLAAAQPDLSRSRLQALIKGGHVSVNDRAARASQRVKAGDRVRVEVPAPEPSELIAEAIPLTVVHEDADIVVIDKPAGLVVHPGAGVRQGTLVHALLHRYPEVAGVGGAGRPGIVHRLDRDTSGLMVVARTPRAYRALVEALRSRAVRRTYAALVWGVPRAVSGAIETAIGRHPRDRKRMAVVPRGGKPARTRWEAVERLGIATRIAAHLDTGRTHQIRVHMEHIGHPVIGDKVYGRAKRDLSLRESERSLAAEVTSCLPRQALHAIELELLHPATGARMSFDSPLPEAFERVLALLRAYQVRRPH
ncbi:MAG: RluA family pseudouridine synthase [Candidatus Eisenbacteria bacterium]|nr:RluA family pseudouridine synthase [Candidatus Eisenbacteria bacterium]